MPGRGALPNKRKFFSLTASSVLILSTILIGLSIQVPNAAGAPQNHYTGNVKLNMLTDFGRIMGPIRWGTGDTYNGVYQTATRSNGISFIGLVIDHDNYTHTPGAEDIAECFKAGPDYGSKDDFWIVNDITMIINDPTTQKSFASFQNKGAGYPDDIFINQTAWTVLNKDWAIIQWSLNNIKGVDLTNVSIGLELPLSVIGGNYGVGGDSGDDIDGYNATNNIYWAQDNDTKTTIGFASAIATEPITHYYSDICDNYTWNEYAYLYQNETWLYERLRAPNSVVGPTPGNRSSTVGWDNFNISADTLKTFTLVIAMGNSFDNMTAAVQDAQYYYHNVASGFRITEISDSGLTTPQTPQIELFNHGRGATDLSGAEYTLFNKTGPLTGIWVPAKIPTYGYSVFTPNENIDAEGDIIRFYENGVLMDEVSFGQEGVAPDPLDGESVARRFDTTMADYSNEWLRNGSTGITFNGPNNVGSVNPTPNIVLNRVGFYPWDPAEAYVELMFRFGNGTIKNFKVVCDDAVEIPLNTPGLTTSNRYYVLNQSKYPALFQNMDSTADNIYLYDANDNLLDMVGWNTPHDRGAYMSRVPDGSGSFQGFNDTTSNLAGWDFNLMPTLKITEFYTDSGQAKIEIYIPRGGDIASDNGHWSLNVSDGNLTGSWAPNPIPGNKGYSIFTWDLGGTGTPGNEGDIISLNYDPGSGWILIDEVGYGTHGVAPDPLWGESTARYWNNSIPRYSNDWTREDSPNFGFQNDVPPIDPTPDIILNEVMYNPSIAPDGRYVVFLNLRPWLVPIDGYSLVCDDAIQFSGDIGPGTAMFSYTPTADQFFVNMSDTADNVYLYDNTGRLLDMVGWNTQHIQGMSVRRVPDGNIASPTALQGHNDVTSEAAGWVFNSPLLNVQMTEISDDDSAVIQIEVYNPWYPTINFTNSFAFRSKSTGFFVDIPGSWVPPGTANSGEYAVFNLSLWGFDPKGDTIRLLQNGILLEEISYGLKGTIPDPLPNESVERYWNGAYYTDVWERNITTGPTFGSQNDVPEANLTSPIVLNEVLFYPTVTDNYFVELYNRGGGAINISGYKIVCNTEFIIPNTTWLDFSQRYYYFIYSANGTFFDSMNSTGDNVYLYNADGALLDMVGWNSQHTQDMTMTRVPEGNGTRDGYDDVSSVAAGWQFNSIPTVSLITIDTSDMREPVKFGHFESYVIFTLTVTNLQGIIDIIDILNSSKEGWTVEIYDETGMIKITDITLNPGESRNIIVNITMPSTFPFPIMDNITITIRSSSSMIIGDSIILTAKVYPFLNLTKTASPHEIYMNGTGHDEITTITLNLTGMGAQVAERRHLDCIFCIDSSGSMEWNDYQNLRITESQNFVANHFERDDRAAIVDFDENPDLLPANFPSGNGQQGPNPWPQADPQDHLSWNYSRIINNFMAIDHFGGTVLWRGLNVSNMELVTNADFQNKVPVIILITDAEELEHPTSGEPGDIANSYNEAYIAASHGIRIYTIGLNINDPQELTLLQDIANITGGVYYDAPDASYFKHIYENISQLLNDLAVWVPPTDPNPMIRDVLPPEIELVGNFNIPYDNMYVDPVTKETVIEWDVSAIKLGETFSVSFDVKSNMVGQVYTNNYTKSRAYYTRWDNTTDTKLFPECWVNVLPPAPIPPKLYIDIWPNKEDIRLYWDEPLSPGTEYYLIYCAQDPRNFNFASPWINTSSDIDPLDPGGVEVPKRLEWNHTGAALPGHGNYAEQYYYCIRGVNSLDETSYSSRTVGKWTKEFTQQGVSTFSLPLEPLETMNTTADFYLTDMGADYIKWMDPFFHNWMKHGDGGVNDTQLEVGEGYEVKFSFATRFTFMGMPGAMIKYNTGSYLGFDYNSDAKNLSAIPDTPGIGDITLQWSLPGNPGTTNYFVYYSTSRDGFHGTKGVHYHEIAILPAFTTSFVHSGVALPNTQYYYMIIPVNATGAEGASTYSIGVWTEGYLAQYDTLGIPLQLTSGDQTADWYCNQMYDVVGINYFVNAEQRWSWHSTRMPAGTFDPFLIMTEGYQISTQAATKYTFIGY